MDNTALNHNTGPKPVPFMVGNTYRTQGGELVRFVSVSNEGTDYETMADEAGVHRYTRRDFGRVTGSAHDYSDPRNVPPLYAAPSQLSEAVEALDPNHPMFGIDFQDEMATYSCQHCEFSIEHFGTTDEAMGKFTHDEDCPVLKLREVIEQTPSTKTRSSFVSPRDWSELCSLADDFVEGYEFRGDDGDYHPTDRERFLITDCVLGLMHELHEALKAPKGKKS